MNDQDYYDGLRITVLKVLAAVVEAEDTRVREEGRPGFITTRRDGHKTQEINFPGDMESPPIAKLTIKGGTVGVDVDPAKLLDYARIHQPEAVRETIPPAALLHPDVRAWIRDNHPELVQQYVDRDAATKLTNTAKRNHGRLSHPGSETGEFTQVGTESRSAVDGSVACTLEPDAIGRVMAALGSGKLGDLGLWPLAIAKAPAPAPAAPPAAVRVVPEPPSKRPVFGWDGQPLAETPLFTEDELPGLATGVPGARAA